MTGRIIALVDMDCFYVQVEERDNLQIKGKPAAVVQYNSWKGGGIIAVNYEARACGVTRQMRGDQAKEFAPGIHLVQVPVHRGKANLTKYRDAGKEVITVLSEFSEVVERASVDEAYIDLTEAVLHRLGQLEDKNIPPEQLKSTWVVGYDKETDGNGQFMREEGLRNWVNTLDDDNSMDQYCDNKRLLMAAVICEEMRASVLEKTGFKCSAGISHSKMLSKLSCGLHKPNQQTILPQDQVQELWKTMPIGKIRNLGGKLGNFLKEDLNCNMMADLGTLPLNTLKLHFDDKNAMWLFELGKGRDHEKVNARQLPKSIGCGKNFTNKDILNTKEKVTLWLSQLSEELSERLIEDETTNKRHAKTLTVGVKLGDEKYSYLSRSCGLPSYCSKDLAKAAMSLIQHHNKGPSKEAIWTPPLMNISFSASKFEDSVSNSVSIEELFKKASQKTNKVKPNSNLISRPKKTSNRIVDMFKKQKEVYKALSSETIAKTNAGYSANTDNAVSINSDNGSSNNTENDISINTENDISINTESSINNDVSVLNNDDSTLNSDETNIDSDDTIIDGDDTIIDSDGTVIDGDDGIIDGDGIDNYDNSVLDSQNHIINNGNDITNKNVVSKNDSFTLDVNKMATDNVTIFVGDRKIETKIPQSSTSFFRNYMLQKQNECLNNSNDDRIIIESSIAKSENVDDEATLDFDLHNNESNDDNLDSLVECLSSSSSDDSSSEKIQNVSKTDLKTNFQNVLKDNAKANEKSVPSTSVVKKLTTNEKSDKVDMSEKLVLELFPNLNNIDESVLSCLPIELQAQVRKMKARFNAKQEGRKALKNTGIWKYMNENVQCDSSSINESLDSRTSKENKSVESPDLYASDSFSFDGAMNGEISVQNGQGPNPTEEQKVQSTDNFVDCTECGIKIQVTEIVEHMDYHLAVSLRKEQQIQIEEVRSKPKEVSNARAKVVTPNKKRGRPSKLANKNIKHPKLDKFFCITK